MPFTYAETCLIDKIQIQVRSIQKKSKYSSTTVGEREREREIESNHYGEAEMS